MYVYIYIKLALDGVTWTVNSSYHYHSLIFHPWNLVCSKATLPYISVGQKVEFQAKIKRKNNHYIFQVNTNY